MSENKERPRLKYKRMDPPGGWCYHDKDTNAWVISSAGFDDLVLKVCEHRKANSLAIPIDIMDQVETFICYRIPEDLVLGKLDRKVTPYSLHAIMRFTQKFLAQIAGHLVDQETAETRAKQCVACSMNKSVVCMDCQGLDIWIRTWTGGRRTSIDDRLHACLADGVFVQASVHADVEFTQAKELPGNCWKRNAKEKLCKSA